MHETRGLSPVEAAFCWRKNRLAKVSFEQEIQRLQIGWSFMLAERGYVFLVLFNAMSANISEEVLTSKTQGLSDEERLREGTRNNRQRSAVEREREKERAWEKRCRSTEVQRKREQETRLKQGKFYCVAEANRNTA